MDDLEDHFRIIEAQEREDFEFERAYWEEQERLRDLEYEEAIAEEDYHDYYVEERL